MMDIPNSLPYMVCGIPITTCELWDVCNEYYEPDNEESENQQI
jgi:hypothetical protein